MSAAVEWKDAYCEWIHFHWRDRVWEPRCTLRCNVLSATSCRFVWRWEQHGIECFDASEDAMRGSFHEKQIRAQQQMDRARAHWWRPKRRRDYNFVSIWCASLIWTRFIHLLYPQWHKKCSVWDLIKISLRCWFACLFQKCFNWTIWHPRMCYECTLTVVRWCMSILDGGR